MYFKVKTVWLIIVNENGGKPMKCLYNQRQVKKLLSGILVMAMIMLAGIVPAYAAENMGNEPQTTINQLQDKVVEFNLSKENIVSLGKETSVDTKNVEIRMDESQFGVRSISGDIYEVNNGPAVATNGRYNQITYATIHEEYDVDWYRINITDITKPISVILTNIPYGNDYDMFLVKYDDINGITAMYYNHQAGNASETLYGTVPEAGTYYVVIQPDTDVLDNYSDMQYKLYVGDYYRTGQYGYTDTGLDISFGYVPHGNTTPVYRGWYSYDLTNNSTIPNDAIVREIYLTSTGNGAYWIGFYKMMAAGGQGVLLDEKIGQINLMYSGDNELLVKQQWLIGGHILVSEYFIWEPSILINYKFPVTIANLNFL